MLFGKGRHIILVALVLLVAGAVMAQPPFRAGQVVVSGSPADLGPDVNVIKYLPNATTPTLIIHSEEDHRCPIEQGEQAFVTLKVKAGVDAEMVRFPGEPHGLSRGGRTDRRIARLNHILRWMDKYLKECDDK